MPTLLALAGVKARSRVDGVSLVGTLRGEKQELRRWLHFEHAPCYDQAQAYHALTDGSEKYVWRPRDGREQLFDLGEDPREERDLSRSPRHSERLRTWRARLVRRIAKRPEGFVSGGKLVAGRPYRALNNGSVGTKEH